MGFEFNGGTLYVTEPSGRQFELGDVSSGIVEIDTLSANEAPNISYNFTKDFSASFEGSIVVSTQDLSFLYTPKFNQLDVFDIEHNVPILVQAKWHKKKRINKKWLKRYGMKPDAVEVKAKVHTFSYNTDTNDCEFEVDKLKYIWRPDQLRKNLKIEM